MINQDKLLKSIKNLEGALKYENKIEEDPIYFAGISKSYEVCLEYSCKYLRKVITEEGLEAYGPKDVIKTAGRLNLIDNVETWIKYINERNLAVHDYANIADEDYLNSAKNFLTSVKKLVSL